MSLPDEVIGLIAPAVCVGCGAEGSALCEACIALEIISYGERCAGCGVLSPNCKTCANCRRSGLPAHIWATVNYEGIIRKLIYRYKFDHQRAAGSVIADLMVETYSAYYHSESECLVIPIPTATKRVRERSFDHSVLLAKEISHCLKLKQINALARLGQRSQVGAGRAERLAQTIGHYRVRYPELVRGKRVLLIDDVMTTGVTLRSAATALRAGGAKTVDALVLAKRV